MNNSESTTHSRPIDMEVLLNDNLVNGNISLKHLRDENYWHYFESTREIYRDIIALKNANVKTDPHTRARLHYLAGSSIDLDKGISNVLSGHFQDSLVFARKTIESARHAIFLRENPEIAKHWFSPTEVDFYKKKYHNWLRNTGKDKCESEIPGSSEHFDRASNYGPHPTPEQFAVLQEVRISEDNLSLILKYNELGKSSKVFHRLLVHYFWHLLVHTCTIDWWIEKSGFIVHLSDDQIQWWLQRKGLLKGQIREINAITSRGPL